MHCHCQLDTQSNTKLYVLSLVLLGIHHGENEETHCNRSQEKQLRKQQHFTADSLRHAQFSTGRNMSLTPVISCSHVGQTKPLNHDIVNKTHISLYLHAHHTACLTTPDIWTKFDGATSYCVWSVNEVLEHCKISNLSIDRLPICSVVWSFDVCLSWAWPLITTPFRPDPLHLTPHHSHAESSPSFPRVRPCLVT